MNELKIQLNKLNFRNLWDVTKAAYIANSPVKVHKLNEEYIGVNAKSMLDLLSLHLRTGDILVFRSEDGEMLSKIRKILSK